MPINLQLQRAHSLELYSRSVNATEHIDQMGVSVNANKAISRIALLLDDAPSTPPLPLLKECQVMLTKFEGDEDFTRLLQVRVSKILDKLIVPSLILYVNYRGSEFSSQNLSETFQIPRDSAFDYGGVGGLEVLEILDLCCLVIQQFCTLCKNGLVIDSTVFVILLNHLVNCYLVGAVYSIEGSDYNPEKALLNCMCCIVETVGCSKEILSWVLSYSIANKEGSPIKDLLHSLLSSIAKGYKDENVTSPELERLVASCIELLSPDIATRAALKFGSALATAQSCLQTRFESTFTKGAKTVLLTPTIHSPAAPNGEAAKTNPLNFDREEVKPPAWLCIFEHLSIRSLNNTNEAEATCSSGIEATSKHPHLNKIKKACSKIYSSIINKQDHWGNLHVSKKELWECCYRYWYPRAAPPTQIITIAAKRPRLTKRANAMKRRRKKRTPGYQRRACRQRRCKRKRKYNYHPQRKYGQGNGVKLQYYYRLNKRIDDAKRLKNLTFERTNLGELGGGFHRLQLKCQSKADKLNFMIYGVEKE